MILSQPNVIRECQPGTPSAKPACPTVKQSASRTRARSKLGPEWSRGVWHSMMECSWKTVIWTILQQIWRTVMDSQNELCLILEQDQESFGLVRSDVQSTDRLTVKCIQLIKIKVWKIWWGGKSWKAGLKWCQVFGTSWMTSLIVERKWYVIKG